MEMTTKEFANAGLGLGLTTTLVVDLAQYYYEGRKPPGFWLQAVLEGSLSGAANGSPIEMSQLKPLTDFVANYWEDGSAGTRDAVSRWVRMGGILGKGRRMQREAQGPIPDVQWQLGVAIVSDRKWRPERWPYPGPIWQFATPDLALDYPGCRLARFVFPEGVAISRVWPTNRGLYSEREYIQVGDLDSWFPEGFPCPAWWDSHNNRVIGTEPDSLALG